MSALQSVIPVILKRNLLYTNLVMATQERSSDIPTARSYLGYHFDTMMRLRVVVLKEFLDYPLLNKCDSDTIVTPTDEHTNALIH